MIAAAAVSFNSVSVIANALRLRAQSLWRAAPGREVPLAAARDTGYAGRRSGDDLRRR
jgi:hypothetical protein